MFNNIDLQALAERSGPERAFVSLYLAGPDSLNSLEQRIRRVRELLDEDSDELEHFERNMEVVEAFLQDYDFDSGSLCLFSCWATDYFQAYKLEKEVIDLLWIDSSPYIRPLAELQDEYENFVVVTADNSETRVFYVTSAVPKEEERIEGEVKNHVRKGGWSQQRYARRRDNELLHYAKEVAEVLADLGKRKRFEYIFLVGSDEAMRAIADELPNSIKEKVAGMRSVDLHAKDEVFEAAFEMFFKEEREWDRSLWETIKGEYLQDGRAVTGPRYVLEAAAVGRVEKMLVTRDAKIAGLRCRNCENLSAEVGETCPVCASESVFKVDLVNELVELLAMSKGEVEFADPIRGLTKAGHVAALLRY
jgi:peptide subunit release factor 1 (eRF1)